jgi:hypothetical protein
VPLTPLLGVESTLTPSACCAPGTEAGLRLNASAPVVWQFVSDSERNALGQPRGYAVAFTGQAAGALHWTQ